MKHSALWFVILLCTLCFCLAVISIAEGVSDPESDFTAEAVQSEIRVHPNTEATMEVRTNCDNGDIVYQWYIYDAYFDEYENFHETRLIEGATGASYTSTSVTGNRHYLCIVYDQYGSERSVDFNVTVENHLRAEAVQEYITVSPNETAEMIINASCDEGSLTYEWFKNEYNEEGGNWYNVSMDSMDATCISDAITKLTYFGCYVKDEYGGFEQVSFVVSVENHFMAEGEQISLTVAPNEQGEMVINASCDNGDLTYRWYKGGYYDEEENWHEDRLIEDAIGPSCTSEPATQYTHYYCKVEDQYKNSDIVNFYILVDNQFTAEAVQSDFFTSPNSTVQMEVNASCGIGSLIYQWYKNGYYDETGSWHEPQMIESATGAVYTSEAIGRYTQYYCHVQDEYGNGQEIWFSISIENHLTAAAVQRDLSVAPNSTATMKVNASCDNGTIMYQWYKDGESYFDEFGNYHDNSLIEGETGDTYISDPITKRGTYYCVVSDLYGSNTIVNFSVSVDNHLTAEPAVSDLAVTPNGIATLEVQASCDEGVLHYEWYMNDDIERWLDFKLIEGENSSTYTTGRLTTFTRYYCYVTDEYGNATDVQFTVNIENHFVAEAVQSNLSINPNEVVAMEVNASCDTGALAYQWYKSAYFDELGNWHETQRIEGATEATYTSEAIIRYTQYYCYVQDEYGNRTSVWFYVCPHENIRDVIDESYTQYEWINNTQHMEISVVTSHKQCDQCGYSELPETSVTEGEPEGHMDADEDGICDVCRQSIQGDFLWEVNGGVLRITGNGVIPDFEQLSDLPWYYDLEIIERVFVEGDFTAIGKNVLYGLKNETRIDFRQRKMPMVDIASISGVCRYYSTDESWRQAPGSWIYLPIFNPDGESLNQVEYHAGTGWETGRYAATGDVSYPLSAKQAVELAYAGRTIELYGIPSGDDLKVITDHWDTTWSVNFQDGCTGTMNLELGSNANYGICFDVWASDLTLNIDASNVESINRILMSAGNVTFTGRIRDVYLRGGYSTDSNLTVNGDVDTLNFYDSTSDAPYNGSLTVNGTIAAGSVYGSVTISVPHVSDEVVFPDMVKAKLANVQQTTPVVTNGVVTVDGVQPISGLTYEDFNLRYHLMPDGWRLDLLPKSDAAGGYNAGIDDVEAYNPEFSTDDILWDETTDVYVWHVRDLGKLEFNGGANGEGLGELTLYCCIAEINCPVTTLRVNQSYTDSDATNVTIKNEIKTLIMEMRKNGNSVFLGEGGSVGGGYWNRYFGENRYFGSITEVGDIYNEGQLKVLSWKDGQNIRALLPSDVAVTEAAGQAATIDLNEVTENALSDDEYDKLQAYLQTQGIGSVAGIFDVSVLGVDANGDIQEGVKIGTLNNDVPLTVSNEANGEAYILRLHENEDGTVNADQLCDATDNEELRFTSNLFSKYVIIDANGTPETGEVSWQIAKQRLIISGNGRMDDYEKPEDAPWYEQREGIKQIILDSGITKVGSNAFCDMADTVRIDFNQRSLPVISENAFGNSNVICRYYREDDSWTGSYGANSIKWVYLPINNQGSDYENIRYYKDSETFGTGWTIYSQETGEIAVSTEQAEEFSFLGRAVYLYAMPEDQKDLDIIEQHWDVVRNLYFFPEGSGTYNLILPETESSLALDFDAPGWTLNVDATAYGDTAIGMIQAGGGTLNVTAQNISTLFLGSSNVYAEPMPVGTVIVHGDVETLNYYNSDNSDRRFIGNATVYGTVKNGYEYGTATAVIPNIPNITAPQMIVSMFKNVNQTTPIVLNSELNVADVESYGVYTPENCSLFYQLYNNEGEDEWRLQISPRTNDNSQPVHIEIADYNPDFTMDDICWGDYTGLSLMKARPGQTVVINGAEGKGLNYIDVTETNVEVNCPVYQMNIGDWSRNGNNFQVTVNNTIESFYINLHWKQCSILLGEKAKINGGYLQQPFYEDLYFEDVYGSGIMMQNSRLMILSHQQGQRISTLLPDEETLTGKAGLEAGQIAIMEATDADGLTEAEEEAFARANIQGTAMEAFDVSVAVYEVDEEGNAGGRIGAVTTLNGEVPIMVKNVTGEEAFVVRLHEDANGEITAEAVMAEASDANVFTFYSDLFSKYVLVKAETPIDLSTLTTLQLPAGLTRIEDNAFEGGAFQAVIIPDGCISIGADAFKDCTNLIYVSYPSGITGIEEAFAGCNIRKMDER